MYFILGEYRQNANLPELLENPIEIIKSMRSSSPPPNSTDLMNLQKRNTRQKRVSCLITFNYYLLFYSKAASTPNKHSMNVCLT